jgi:hypothetical protein
MPRVLFSANFLENGVYTRHVRVGFATAHEQREFLERNRPLNMDGWAVTVAGYPARSYTKTPVYQADLWLSTVLPPPWQPAWTVRESAPEGNGYQSDPEKLNGTESVPLTWQQRSALQTATEALLREFGIADRKR